MAATVINLPDLQQRLRRLRDEQKKVAFVPTMGALHEGHLALVKHAKTLADEVVVSIFVNPKQFGPNEDFARYPRKLAKDVALLSKEGVSLVFAPNAVDIYPDGFQTFVVNVDASQVLCGRTRPDHFRGVLTVVLKLFNLVTPDIAVFGKKDYQQLWLIRKMVEDLSLNVEVVGCDTTRENSGLALSSRNSYLTSQQAETASQLYEALKLAKHAYEGGETKVSALLEAVANHLSQHEEFELEYLDLRRQRDLGTFELAVDEAAVMLLAVHFSGVRLIDNIELGSRN